MELVNLVGLAAQVDRASQACRNGQAWSSAHQIQGGPVVQVDRASQASRNGQACRCVHQLPVTLACLVGQEGRVGLEDQAATLAMDVVLASDAGALDVATVLVEDGAVLVLVEQVAAVDYLVSRLPSLHQEACWENHASHLLQRFSSRSPSRLL